jgi:hypothetical protein
VTGGAGGASGRREGRRVPALGEGEGLEAVGGGVLHVVLEARAEEAGPDLMNPCLKNAERSAAVERKDNGLVVPDHAGRQERECERVAHTRDHQDPLQQGDVRPEFLCVVVVLPPHFRALTVARLAGGGGEDSARPDLLLHDRHQLGPALPTLSLAPPPEVDHVPMVRVGGAGVDLLAADIREHYFLVGRVPSDQAAHLAQWRGDARRVSVVKQEPHAIDLGSEEGLAGIGRQTRRVSVATAVEEEGCDGLHLAPVQPWCAGKRTLADVQHADYHRRHARPLDAPARGVDPTAVLADPAQA